MTDSFPIPRRTGVLAAMLNITSGALSVKERPFHSTKPNAASVPSSRVEMAIMLSPFQRFYRSGALVFGGGHVVLPLLQAAVVAPGWVTNEVFLAGYGMARPCRDRSSPSPPISAQ